MGFKVEHFENLSIMILGPKGLCWDSEGRLLVVDNKASCVLVFGGGALLGRMLARFGNRGCSPHQFAGPHFLAIDSEQRIVVSDFHNHSVKVSQLYIYIKIN